MWILFLICAVVGGTVLFFQLALMLIGFGGEALDMDVPDDVDVDMDLDVDVGMDMDVDADVGMDVDADVDLDAADAIDADADHLAPALGFRVLTFRTVVAALTFFGLAGMAGLEAGYSPPIVLALAILAGGGAMYLVYWLFSLIKKLQSEGTVKIRNAVGAPATVYVPIPPNKSGAGKIQCNLQNRTMEYLAMTPGDRLSTGAKVVVTGVITSNTLEVEPIPETERSDDV